MKKIKEIINFGTEYKNEALGCVKITKVESLFSEEEFAEFADKSLSVYAKETALEPIE
jgi:hypothetical protein